MNFLGLICQENFASPKNACKSLIFAKTKKTSYVWEIGNKGNIVFFLI